MDINAFFQELDTYFQTRQVDKVEPFLLSRLVAANQEHDRDASLAIMNELIGFYRSQKRHEDSVRVTEQALALCRSEYITGTVSHATTLLNGATAYRFAGYPQKALALFAEAEAIYKKENLPSLDERYAGLYNNIASVYAELGQLELAAEHLERSAAIIDAFPDKGAEAAVTHANLAALYFKLGRYAAAKREIARACGLLQGSGARAAEYEQFRAMREVFSQYPD